MKKTISVMIAILIAFSSFSISTLAYSNGDFQISVEQAIEEYELLYEKKVETNRYFFLMPNGENGDRGEDIYADEYTVESYGKYEESWFNEYSNGAAIYWWDSGIADPEAFPGYRVTGYDSLHVYYADIPKAVEHIIWNNNVDGGMDPKADIYNYARMTTEISTKPYEAGESDIYEQGLDTFDNMIYVIDPDKVAVSDISQNYPRSGEWYYYYGDGCYGTVKDGSTEDCIRDDHNHSVNFLYFDANSTDWEDYKKVFCHIWEYGGDSFYAWQTKAEGCTDEDKDGVWTYDLDKAKIKLEPDKKYAVIFSNEKGEQTYHLELRTTHIGETAYLTQKIATDANTDYRVPAWRTQCLYFDANTTNWKNYKKIFCHIWEYGGDSFYAWQAKAEGCTDKDGDGIWTYDLDVKGIALDDSKQYMVIFSNENGLQTYNLLFDNTVLGDTAYCDDTFYTSPEDMDRTVQGAFWRNQDEKEFGPEMVVLFNGEVVGTCIPKGVTEEDMFKEFLVNKLEFARSLSGKTDQQILDDLAKELGLSSNDVESAIIETGIENIEWVNYDSTPIEELDIETLIERYKFRTGDEFETKRYYFMMPDRVPTYSPETPDEEKEEAWTWYNEYSDCAYIYWDGIDDLLPEPSVMPDDSTRYLEVGCKAMQGDEYNVYYADIPDFVTSIVWNNGVKVKDEFDPMFPYAHRTENIMCEYYDAGESETYPDGLDSFDNMIYVLEEGAQSFGNPVACEKGEWYYYYGDECYGTKENGGRLDCINPYHSHFRKQSVSEARAEYEAQTGEKVETNRYYFLMPNGSNGEVGKFTDSVWYNKYTPTWYNEYTDGAGIWWLKSESFNPKGLGYMMEKTDVSDVYYADVPKDAQSLDFNNLHEIITDTDYDVHTSKGAYPPLDGYAAGENENYPDGLESFDNMIFVIYPDLVRKDEYAESTPYKGEWYYYYGDGCYGFVENGSTADCMRDDHEHKELETYIVAGVEKLCGSSWDIYDTNNKMTYNEKTDLYEITYTDVVKGHHEFIVTKNYEYGTPDFNTAKVENDGATVKITCAEDGTVEVIVIEAVLGDVDGDGVISIMDATEIQLAMSKKKTLTEKQEKLADTDKDGEISIMDATAIQLYVAKKITQF